MSLFPPRGKNQPRRREFEPLARNPAVVDVFLEDGHEIASHGWRWISYQQIDENVEREHMRLAIDTITRLTGRPPDGWYTGRDSANTRRLVAEHGGFTYFADSLMRGLQGARTHAYWDVAIASAVLMAMSLLPLIVKRLRGA